MAITRRLPGSFTASPVSALTTTVGAVRFAIVLALAASIAPVLLVGAVAEGGEALPYSYDGNEELAPTNDVANATSPLARATNGARRDTDLRHGLRLAADLVAPRVAGLADEGFVDPSTIRFSQNSVSPNFSAGGSVDDLATGLRNGSVSPGDVPPISIFESNGQWMSLDNRRLVAFQQAGVQVPYRLATAQEIAAQTWKVTTTNGGTSITIRGGGGTWPR
ncbi:MAG: hypothetical protein GY750_02735 [Lentisphaerae bacterium]|nr:hypothetical protein [Lentisphaerota bacterium]